MLVRSRRSGVEAKRSVEIRHSKGNALIIRRMWGTSISTLGSPTFHAVCGIQRDAKKNEVQKYKIQLGINTHDFDRFKLN